MRAMVRLATAACLAATGYLHTDLYLHGYRAIPFVGLSFLLLASGSFAVAMLLLMSGSPVLRLLAAGLAAGALLGFLASRTVGLFGFSERGLDPAPQSLLSLLFEFGVLAALAFSLVAGRHPRMAAGPAVR
ncbi:MAG TPA: hypothetical protein VGD84_06925 [Pseudonocardiaceae bacterium]